MIISHTLISNCCIISTSRVHTGEKKDTVVRLKCNIMEDHALPYVISVSTETQALKYNIDVMLGLQESIYSVIITSHYTVSTARDYVESPKHTTKKCARTKSYFRERK